MQCWPGGMISSEIPRHLRRPFAREGNTDFRASGYSGGEEWKVNSGNNVTVPQPFHITALVRVAGLGDPEGFSDSTAAPDVLLSKNDLTLL